MAQFMISYIGGDKPTTEEEGKAHMAEYMEWLDSLGEAAVSPMNPLKDTHTVSPNGDVAKGSQISMSGYTLVAADSIEDTVAMAKACPFLGINGTLEVSELMQMGG